MINAWGIVPARGGSKSIPLKNIVSVHGRPLLEYVLRAGRAAGLRNIIGSTDEPAIAEVFKRFDCEIDVRPAELSGDDVAAVDVVRRILRRCAERPDYPEVIVLLQPTSPFTLPEHIVQLVQMMEANPNAASGQTIYPCPHAFHTWNQREFSDSLVRFMYAEERTRAFNKQKKPKTWVFGNVFAVRSKVLLDGGDFYTEPSVGLEIPQPYGFDLDVARDVAMAEAMIDTGIVALPHMQFTDKRGEVL